MKRMCIICTALVFLVLVSAAFASDEEVSYRPADLPVVYVYTDGGKEEADKMNASWNHSYRCTGTMDILVPEGYDGEFEGRFPQESVNGLKMKYIRGRGNGTWGMSKKPYKIKLEEKADLFGMGKNKTWILLANFFDNSLIRNWLTAWLGEAIGMEYTPQGVFVELVMNGEYLGNYYLCEQVQISKVRLPLDELKEENSDFPEIQGGYLLDFNPDEENEADAFMTSHGLYLANNEPSFDTEDDGWQNDAQKQYIRDYIQKTEDAIYTGNAQIYTEFLDLQSLADYWWIQEFTVNGDGFRTDSAHMYKKRFEPDGSEGKLYFGPLWDFDESWGNAQQETAQAIGFNNCTFIWADELRTKPEFQTVLRERWQVIDEKLEEIIRENGVLDQTAAIIRKSWERDYERWKDAEDLPDAETRRSFDAEIGHIREWIRLRREWVREHLDETNILKFTVTLHSEGLEDREYQVESYSVIDPWMFELPESEGREITGWQLEDGKATVDWIVVDRDMTVTVQYK